MKNKKIVLIPVETISRELDFKITLGHEIANIDTVCIIGQHNYLNKLFKYFNGGIYLGKNVLPDLLPCRLDYFDDLKRNQFSLYYYHEEGGVFKGDEADWRLSLSRQIDPSLLDEDDYILCWGAFQKEFYLQNTPKCNIENVGVGRLDLSEKDSLRTLVRNFSNVQLSNFILINTNFAVMNHYLGPSEMLEFFSLKSSEDPDTYESTLLWYSEVMKIMGSFLELLVKLASTYPNETFVLRPHPTESMVVYEYFSKNYKNIIVTKSSTSHDWINKCKAIIHNGCTTSLEAYFMKKPVLNYIPFENEHSVKILEDIGYRATNFEQVNYFIQNLDKYDYSSKDLMSSNVSRLINNFNQNTNSTQIIKNLVLNGLKTKSPNDINVSKLKFIYFKSYLRNCLALLPRKFFPSKQEAYKMHKSHFDGMDKKYIEERVTLLNNEKNSSTKLNILNDELFLLGG